MKKSFILAGVIAVVALLATSCKPKVAAPTARFGYESNELKVTFINLSKEATEYVWDFGDGSATDTAAAPVHVYPDYGDYTVQLIAKNAGGQASYTDEVSLVKRVIAIDGDFSDWEAVDDQVAKAEANESAKEKYFYNAKFLRDGQFIYFYLEFDGAKADWEVVIDEESGATEIQHDYAVKHMSLWLNLDNTLGCDIWWWAAGAHIDFLVEGGFEDNFEGATVYQCPEDLNGGDNSEWVWDETGIIGAVYSCNVVTLGNGHKAIEGKIMTILLPLQPTDVVKMGIGALAPDWGTYTGRLPQTTVNADGTDTLGELIEVPLAAE